MPTPPSGFSLIELMATVALVALLATLGAPSFHELALRMRVDAAMQRLTVQMALTRNTAIVRRTTAALCPANGAGRCRGDGDWSSGWLLYLDGDGNRQPDSASDILREEPLPLHPSLRIFTSSSRPQLRYLPDGRSGGSNMTVRLCHRDTLMGTVVVSNGGRVRTERPLRPTACAG